MNSKDALTTAMDADASSRQLALLAVEGGYRSPARHPSASAALLAELLQSRNKVTGKNVAWNVNASKREILGLKVATGRERDD